MPESELLSSGNNVQPPQTSGEPRPQLTHASTTALVEERKAEVEKGMPIWVLILQAVCGTITTLIYLYIGYYVQPASTCGQITLKNGKTDFDNSPENWKTWYRIEGVITGMQAYLAISMALRARAMATNENMLKLAIYQEQGREEDAEAALDPEDKMEMAVAGVGMCCNGCGWCLVSLFDVGWIIYGMVLYIQTQETCTVMTKMFFYVALYNLGMFLLVQIFKWACSEKPRQHTLMSSGATTD